jgi:hypothetical protein
MPLESKPDSQARGLLAGLLAGIEKYFMHTELLQTRPVPQ